jgi:hypothetical protein
VWIAHLSEPDTDTFGQPCFKLTSRLMDDNDVVEEVWGHCASDADKTKRFRMLDATLKAYVRTVLLIDL